MQFTFKKYLPTVLLVSAIGFAYAEELGITLSNSSGISLNISPNAGVYSVKYNSEQWMGNGLVSVLVKGRWYRSGEVIYPEPSVYKLPEGRLLLQDTKRGSANDRLGSFDFVSLTWKIPDADIRLITSFRMYRDKPYLVFTQDFPDGFKDYASGDWTVPSVAFPDFLQGMENSRRDIYSWISGGMFAQRFAYGAPSALGGTADILLLTDQDFHAAVLSPISNYLVATQQNKSVATRDETQPAKAAITCGIEGLVQDIPAGYKHEHILVVGSGVTNTLRLWGQALLVKAGKQVPSKYTGDNLKYPTYWDDYGAYYREHDFKEEGYKTYEDIILAVAADAKKNGLRIGAYEVTDSDQIRFAEGLFEPRDDLFPHGLKWLHEQLGAPLIAYIPWLASRGPYRRKYPYFETPKGNTIGAFPGSMGDVFYSESYWKDTANKMGEWGVTELQQDFMSTYAGDPVMMADVDRMNLYLKNQAKALQGKGMTMQYCMTDLRNIMESTENPVATTLQGTNDHHVPMAEPEPTHDDLDPLDWKHILFTSALYGAVGLWPSRDNTQTVADPNALEDLLLANLMGGEIQLGHRIGEADFELIRKTYREGDGLVLKPQHPIAPLDRCYLVQCAVGWTSSEIEGRQWFYVLSLPAAGYLPDFEISDLHVNGKWAVYDYDMHTVSVVDASTAIPMRQAVKHEYLVVAPVLPHELAVFGDVSKFVSMADMRIASVRVSEAGVDVGVIASKAKSPIITGYADILPRLVTAGEEKLIEQSSLERLERASSGWFWDHQTRLWHVKMDFSKDAQINTRVFRISK